MSSMLEELKLELLIDPGILLMINKGIEGGICYTNHRYAIENNKCMKDYNTNKELSYLLRCDVKNLYVWEVSQNLPKNNFR